MAKDWRRPTEAARKHWKQREAGETSTAARGLKRLLFTLLSVVLVGVLIWYLIPRGQKVYFAYLAEDYGPGIRNSDKVEVATIAPPVASSRGTYEKVFSPLGERIFSRQFTIANVAANGNSKLAAEKLVETLTAPLTDKWNLADVDFVVLYVNAHGVAIDGEPYLMWNEDYAAELAQRMDGQTKPRLMKFGDLLASVKDLAAKQKLLVLDSGQMFADPRLGFFVNEFPRLVEQQVGSLGDRSLWVFMSNSSMQQAHVFAADRTSVFGRFVAKGMAGASRSRDDQDVSLGEFVDYVTTQVRETVASRTGNLQTPRFINGERGVLSPDDVPSVTFLKHDFFNREVEIAAADSQSARGNSRWPTALAVLALSQAPSGGGDPASPKPAAPAQPSTDLASPGAATAKPADAKPGEAKPADAAKDASAPPANPPAAQPGATAQPASPPAATPADAPQAASTQPPTATPATPPAAGDKKGEPATLDFRAVWDRVEKIEDPHDTLGAWSPVDYAPHLWAQLRRQLTWYQVLYEADAGSRRENSQFLATEIFAPLDRVLLRSGEEETAAPPTSIDVFAELQRARAAFRNGPAYQSVADTSRRSVQNFASAVRLKNYLTYRVVEQVRHYGYVADPQSMRYAALDAAIAELSAAATQLDRETQASLNEAYWTSDFALLTQLRNLRARLHESPDLQRTVNAVATVPAEAPAGIARSQPRDVTDKQPAQWADLYLKLARLSTATDSGSPTNELALIAAGGAVDNALTEHVDRIRRIAGGEPARAEIEAYWKAYRAIGLAVRGYVDGLDDGLRRSGDAAPDEATLESLERRLRLVDGRDASTMSLRDNIIGQRRICPRVAPRVEIILADAKIGLPPKTVGNSARKTIAPAYRWNGEVGAKATVRVVYENKEAGSKVVRIVNPTSEFRLSPQGTLPEIALEQADARKDKTTTETARLRILVDVAGFASERPDAAVLDVDAHGSELVSLAAYRVRESTDVAIDSRRDDEFSAELPAPRVTEGSLKPRLFQVRVHPFPNRSDQYRFALTNVSGAEAARHVTVDIYEARIAVDDPLEAFNARGELKRPDFRVVEQFHRELALSANAPQTYPFEPPAKPAAEGDAKPPAAAAPAAAAPAADAKKDDAPPQPIADFRHAMVFAIADKNKPELRWYYWIDFRARKPDQYVEPTVTYHRDRGKLEIVVSPRANSTPPPDGFAARWTTDGVPIAPQLPRTMEVIKKRTDEIRLGVSDWHPSQLEQIDGNISLFVTVDDYPRAFVYNLTSAAVPGVAIRATENLQRVQIVDPPRDLFAYDKKNPGEAVTVRIGIEADGQPRPFNTATVAFNDGNNPPKPLHAWRAEHVLLFDKGWDKEGAVTLTSTVGDHVGADAIPFETTLAESLIDVRVELRAGETTLREDSLQVVVDEHPPSLTIGDPDPPTAKAEKGLAVTVTPTVSDSGGVSRIEFFIFPESKDRLLDEDQKKPDFIWPPAGVPTPPVVAEKPIVVKIPFDRGPGRWTIWAVAVNQVERRSKPERTTNPFDVSAADSNPPPDPGGVTISGITFRNDEPLANVKVDLFAVGGKDPLQSTTSVDPSPVDFVPEAVYKFENVAPGTYRIEASGKAKNGRTIVGRVPKVEITDKDKGMKSFDIKLMLP